jgi:hypothetical protein
MSRTVTYRSSAVKVTGHIADTDPPKRTRLKPQRGEIRKAERFRGREGNEAFRTIPKARQATANPLSPVRIRAAPLGQTVVAALRAVATVRVSVTSECAPPGFTGSRSENAAG